jgi:DNA uptake protein ComE-like DNA-binding protein
MTVFRCERRNRRGAVLLAVMLVITIAALVGTSVLYVADAQRGSASRTLEQAQLRSLAWSGVQAAMSQLHDQRDALLRAEPPTLTGEWSLFESATSGDVRLAPLGPAGETAASESARLDLNAATAAMLAKLPGLNEELAAKVSSGRGKGFGSTEELAAVPGLPASLLIDLPDERSAPSEFGTATPGLLALTTVFAFDPNLAPDDQPRINLSQGWSDELKAQIAARFPDDAALLESTFATAGKLTKDADLIAALRRQNVQPDWWDDVLSLVTTSDEQYLRGRVDLNLAPVEVLAAIPGLDRAAAEKVIDARSRVSAEDRQKVTWPLTQGALTPEQFQASVDWLTTRSLQWRVRVEARLTPKSQAEKTLGSTLKQDSESLDAPGIVWEAVIDVSGDRPRVAYLRDVTHLPALARQALALEQNLETQVAANPADSTPGSDAVSDLATEPKNAGLKSNADLKLGTMKRQGLDLKSGLKLGSGMGGTRAEDGASPPEATESAGSGASGASGGGSPPPSPQDRRIGRWRGTK